MTALPFFKYQATGNDFILIDNTQGVVSPSVALAQQLCDRKFGIGSDGIIFIQPHPDHHFEMVFYNPDGSQSLCGNGSRCAVNFAKKIGLVENECTFMAYDGVHQAYITEVDMVRLKMADVHTVSKLADGTFIDTGSPHLLVFSKNINSKDVVSEGKSIRYNDTFKTDGVNVNFVEVMSPGNIYVRTYERGVENETLSCGTGVTASALASSHKGVQSPVKITTKGGQLEVAFEKTNTEHFENIYLTGSAQEVYSGIIKID